MAHVDPDDPDLVHLEEALTAVVRRSHVPRAQEEVAARAGLRLERAAYPLLRRISEHDAVRVTDVAHDLAVDVSTVSRQVRQLETECLVTRAGDPSDGRASTLALTPAGREALVRLRRARREVLAEVVAGWHAADRRALAGLLERFSDDLAAHQGSP